MNSIPIVELRAFGLELNQRQNVLYLLLVVLIFSLSITTGTWDLGNSRVVMYHELVFILGFALLKLPDLTLTDIVRRHRLALGVLAVWLVSVSISLWASPMGLRHITIAQFRYAETLTHVVFFLCLYLSLLGRDVPYLLLVKALVYSNALVVVHAFLTWHFSPEEGIHSQRMWFSFFPFTGHARHAGYNMLVSSIFALALVCSWRQGKLGMFMRSLAAFLVLACLVWLGGRGAMLSLVLAVTLVAVVAGVKMPRRRRLIGVALITLCAIFAAEGASQFRFNGLSGSITRSVDADSLNALSSSRLAIWQDSLEKLEGNWLMGLGSQAYIFLPDKIARKTSMPHNLVVQFLVEWGIIGTSIMLALLAWLYFKGLAGLYRSRSFSMRTEGEWVLMGAAAVTIALGLHGLTDGTFYHGKPSFYFALCAALWLSMLVTDSGGTDKKCH